MTPAIEPVPLRLPRDLLVLQPMQGHLDLEPVLLMPGLRCAIGSAESCAVRLTKSDIVQPEHCVLEVDGRQVTLTEWTLETTWLNDRLVVEPCDLVAGDRVSLGPFDFRLRLASDEELRYARWVELDNADNSESESHEQLAQHIAKLIGDLQSQVLELQEREANLSEQLRQQHEVAGLSDSRNSTPSAALPESMQSEYEQVLRLLQAERDQLDQERSEFSAEQACWQEQQLAWTQRLEALERELRELEAQRTAVTEEKDICRALAEELLRDKVRLEDWQDRLRQEERDLAAQRDELDRRSRATTDSQAMPIRPRSEPVSLRPVEMASPVPRTEPVNERRSDQRWEDLEAVPNPNRSFQTFLTLIAFGVSAFFLGTDLGDSAVTAAVGWTTALVGAISTLDLVLRRCWTATR